LHSRILFQLAGGEVMQNKNATSNEDLIHLGTPIEELTKMKGFNSVLGTNNSLSSLNKLTGNINFKDLSESSKILK
jgi:hypothetical protein